VAGLDGPLSDMSDWKGFMTAFKQELNRVLNRIFSEDEDYSMTTFRRRCVSCPYRSLCRR